jgi:serine/threonine-protein kinase
VTGPLAVGVVVGGRYEVLDYLGAGGMQFVYAARDSLADRKVALKTPKNPSATKRFHRGAVVAAKVNHPNVAKTLDYVEEDGNLYLIEELIEGADMEKALLSRSKFLDPYLVAKAMHHLAKGLAAAHRANVVHRDLKPTNVMVVGGFSLTEVKITDFGIAKMAGEVLDAAIEGGTATMAESLTAVGALPYMAPEAIDTPKLVGQKADIWSLGALVYHLLCGAPPYGIGLRIVKKILEAEPPEQPAFLFENPQFEPLARQLMDLVLSCMRRDPADRPTADDLVGACGRLCYAVSPRREGTVKSVSYDAHGFISVGFPRDVFFHKASFHGTWPLAVGERVCFSSYQGGGADRAHPVIRLIDDEDDDI